MKEDLRYQENAADPGVALSVVNPSVYSPKIGILAFEMFPRQFGALLFRCLWQLLLDPLQVQLREGSHPPQAK